MTAPFETGRRPARNSISPGSSCCPDDGQDFREITEQLRYIAKNDELDTLKKYRDAPAGEQKVALEAFWKRRDPTPDTDRNEHMITYYRRIAYANEHFDDGLRKGWRSDQGRVYMSTDRRTRWSGTPGTGPTPIHTRYGTTTT